MTYTGPSNVSMLLKPRYLDAAPRKPWINQTSVEKHAIKST